MAGEIVESVEMLRRLVAFDTTSRNSNLALIEYVQKYLQEHGIDSKLVPTEAGIFRKVLGVPTVVCGPGDIAQAHQPNEYILAPQIDACEGFMHRMVEWCSRD